MNNQGITITELCDAIQDSWGSIRNSEKVLAGIEREFKHLTTKELQELWFFIRDNSAKLKYPTVANIKAVASDQKFRIRESSVNRFESRQVCGQCQHENDMKESYCTSCGKHLSDLPNQCYACGYVFPADFSYGGCPHTTGEGEQQKKCGVYRMPVSIKRVMV